MESKKQRHVLPPNCVLVDSYWRSLSLDRKKGFLKIRVEDLKFHLDKLRAENDLSPSRSEALLQSLKDGKVWKLWTCCQCRRQFSSSETFRDHVRQHHLENLPSILERFLTEKISYEWTRHIVDGDWKPLQASASLEILNGQTNITEGVKVEYAWPLSDDPQRENLLKKIQKQLFTLLTQKYLCPSVLDGLITLSKHSIVQTLGDDDASLLLEHVLPQSVICFLDRAELEGVFTYLLELCNALRLVINYDGSTDPMDGLHGSNQIPGMKEDILFNEDASFLFLDECLVPAETTPSDDVYSHNTDPFISWLFSCSSYRDELALSLKTREEDKLQALELVQSKIHKLVMLSEKCKPTDSEEVLQLSENGVEMLRAMAEMEQSELKLESISAFDYGAAVKTFLRAILEALAKKDAMDKLDATVQEYFTPLTLDAEDSVGSAPERLRDWVHMLWNSKDFHSKRKFLSLMVSDLQFSDDSCTNELVARAVSDAKANNKWKVWLCCSCDETFSDPESHRQHVVVKHVGNLPPELHKLLPQNVDEEWISQMLYVCSWKPLDASASVVMLENQAKCEDFSFPRNWPLSDDTERATLLNRIRGRLAALIRDKYLASSHLGKVVRFAMDEIPGLATASRMRNIPLDESPTCICFLGALQLKKILKFLNELTSVCGLVMNCDKSTKDSHNTNQIPEIQVFLSEDASCLSLDECLVQAEITPSGTGSAATDDVITASSNDVVLPNTDTFLSWLFLGPCYREQVTLSLRTKEDNKLQGLELVATLEREFEHLLDLSRQKFDLTNYEEALQVIKNLCLEEGKKRTTSPKSVQQSYGSVLRMRKETLISFEVVGNVSELAAITDVLREAETMNANQSGYEKIHTVPCNLKSPRDGYIEAAIEQQKEEYSARLSKIDAQIMRTLAKMRRLELKLESISAFDHRAILLPVMKKFLRENLKDLAKKYAKEKSGAATTSAQHLKATHDDNEQHILDTTFPGPSSTAGGEDPGLIDDSEQPGEERQI